MSEIEKPAGEYSASNIQVLEGIEHVRKRPAMYIGDVGERGLHHLVYEVVDNSIDEAMAGFAKNIWVTIFEDNSIGVRDDGRGIPVGIHEKEGLSALELVMTRLGAGGKFDKNTYKVSGGLHGVGVSCVNALSTKCDVKVYREGKIHAQGYEKGKSLGPVEVIGTTDERGTETHFWPDQTIFTASEYKFETLASRLRELAYLNRGVRITLVDRREPLTEEELNKPENKDLTYLTKTFYSEGGLAEFVQFLDGGRNPLHEEPIYFQGIDKENTTPVEIAIQYNSSYYENIHSYVNNINTHEGGTHVSGFKKALTRTLKSYAENEGLLKKVKFNITGDDFREGLTCVISVKVAEPQFEGQTKTKLGNNEVSGIVESIVGASLKEYLEENPQTAKNIISKVLIAAEARHAAKKARDAVQKRTASIGGGLPGKLANCSSRKAEECEIFLVEGDSAGGSAKQARDRKFQAILPLRGKILNVEKAHPSRIYENEEIKNIVLALGISGIGPNEELNLEKLRYHKVIIMTDADIDGSHIRTLLLTLFYRNMQTLIEAGHVYIAQPPLYQVKVGKQRRYCWTEADRLNAIEEMAKGDESKVTIQRYKGLGEMNPEQLWETTMDLDRRTLQKVSIESAADADHLFSTLMGDEVAPRREFIERNAKYANIDA
ncbi:DNA topoisomerase (ATP-hydrolyzing) subunit B [Pontibacter sp. G13]|uniref:DNA topoisomerase (ATP-hydrolyzing) subunit B n=1 Tax=Pontibacter sp. G13 TaxID=3074898 RepID=UPI00288BB36A|nr:DNA topoisomerase (ATP-hydrolyzing) subunit B [Pontibacter sp. G13]WNJ20246.1 DNA topoisomerase (ATP-hydrolyzing) subunit B [Pontibacter sp. G13]